MSPLPPAIEDRFEVRRELGEGSYGRVLAVTRRADGLAGALKLTPLQGDGRRELRELRAAAGVKHPHVVATHDVGIDAGFAWIFMELAEASLEGLAPAPAAKPAAWEVLRDAFRGVAGLHAAGMVHRDLKPANILVVGGRGKVADLGLARGDSLETLTRTGMIHGTPEFMSPEQARGEAPIPAMDAWALGVITYLLLEDRLPHRATEPIAILGDLARGKGVDGRAAAARLAPAGRRALGALLAPDAAARPVDLARVAEDLGDWPGGAVRAGETQVLGPAQPKAPPAPRNRGRVALVAGLGALLFVFGLLVPGEGAAPAPPAASPPLPAVPPGVPVDHAAKLRPLRDAFLAELRAAETLAVDRRWEVRPAEALGTGERRLIGSDPALWGLLADRLPSLARLAGEVHTLLEAGPAPDAARRLLRSLDGDLQALGLPALAGPFLDLAPRPLDFQEAALLVETARGGEWIFAEAPGLGPWAAAVLTEYVQVRDRLTRLAQELDAAIEGAPNHGVPAEVVVNTRRSRDNPFLQGPPGNPLRDVEAFAVTPGLRADMVGWLGPEAPLRRLFVAVIRSLRVEPGTRENLATWATALSNRLAGYWYHPFGFQDPSTWLPPGVESPAEALFRAYLLRRTVSLRKNIGLPWRELSDRGLALLEMATRIEEGDGPAGPRRRLHALTEMAVQWARRRRWAEAWDAAAAAVTSRDAAARHAGLHMLTNFRRELGFATRPAPPPRPIWRALHEAAVGCRDAPPHEGQTTGSDWVPVLEEELRPR